MSPAPAAPPRQTATTFVRHIALAPAMPAILLLAWALLLMLGSQVPQADAPTPVLDGLVRSDLLMLEAFGLHRLGAAVPTWLLAAVSAIVVAARWLFPEQLGLWSRHSNDPGTVDASAMGQGTVLDRNSAALARIGARLRVVGTASRLRQSQHGLCLRVGQPVAGAALLGLAAMAALSAWFVFAAAPLPVWTDVQPGASAATLTAWTADGGALAPASGRWSGTCLAAGEQLECELQVSGGHGKFVLAPGRSAELANYSVTWLARANAPSQVPEVELRWLGGGRPSLLKLPIGEVGESPDLGLRLQPFATRTAGPLLIGVRAADHTLFALTSPLIAPPGARHGAATVQTPEVVRLIWSPRTAAGWLLAIALALFLLGGILAWTLPVLQVEAGPDGMLLVRRCNRSQLLAIVAAAGEPSPT
jgi:hypothetical protein